MNKFIVLQMSKWKIKNKNQRRPQHHHEEPQHQPAAYFQTVGLELCVEK